MAREIEIELPEEMWDWVETQVKELKFKDYNEYINHLVDLARLGKL